MAENKKFDEIPPRFPGDKILRIRKRNHRPRLRIIPNIPGILRFIKDMGARTPLIPLILSLTALWLLCSLGIYLAERGENEQINSYGYALWWSLTAMQTQGANAPGPITTHGIVIGSIWSIFSTVAFFGVIIGSFYAYYMLPSRHPSQHIISAIQYNLEEIENLSIDELEALKDVTVRTIDVRINRAKEKTSG